MCVFLKQLESRIIMINVGGICMDDEHLHERMSTFDNPRWRFKVSLLTLTFMPHLHYLIKVKLRRQR